MRALALLLALTACGERVAFADASVDLPTEGPSLPPGTHVELVRANCLACHSADMILHQPRLTRAQWAANVAKMRAVWKAPIDDADVPAIVDYLVTTNAALTRSAIPPRAARAPGDPLYGR